MSSLVARRARRVARDEVAALQRWFQAAVMHPRGAAGASRDRAVRALLPRPERDLAAQLEPSRQLGALERLDVYASAYFLRLRDVLRNDYPGVLRALGEDAFERVAREYVRRHPSTSFTLNELGARFPKFLAQQSRTREVAARRAFVAEVATLERAVEEVFHAPLLPAAPVAPLRELPIERWSGARFVLQPSLRLLAFQHEVDPWLQAVLDGRRPPPVRERPSFVLVYRKEWRTWRARLERDAYRILTALAGGSTLGKALERTLARRDADGGRTLSSLGRWFQEWTGEGIFTAIRLPGRRQR